jgi:hypothetical protein
MPTDHPEPIDLQAAAPAKSSGKMQRLLRPAFKRGDDAADRLSRSSGSGSSSSMASSRRRAGDGDRCSHESFELDGETAAFSLACSVHPVFFFFFFHSCMKSNFRLRLQRSSQISVE